MAHYPLITGNNHPTANGISASRFDLDDNGAEEIFDVYTFENNSNSIQAAYAIVVVKNTGAPGSLLEISEIELAGATDSTILGNVAVSSFTVNPLNTAGKIFVGKPEFQASGDNVLSTATAVPRMGDDSDSVNHVANMFLQLADNTNIDEEIINNAQLGTVGRIIPIYTISNLIANPIPANSYGAFVVQYAPSAVEAQNSSTSINISSNTGVHNIILQKESFNNIVLVAHLGKVDNQGELTVAQSASDTGVLDLGYYGRAKTVALLGTHVGDTKTTIRIKDVSTQVGAVFTWIKSGISGADGSLSLGGDAAVSANATLSHYNLGSWFVGGNSSGWWNFTNYQDADDVVEGNYILTSTPATLDPNNTNPVLYKNVSYFYNSDSYFHLGTRNIIAGGPASGTNYALNEFAVGQVYGVQFDSDLYAYSVPQKNFMFILKAGIYERMTIPLAQMNKTAGYNLTTAGSGITPPVLASSDGTSLNGSNVRLIINVRWNNWARASSGVDNGSAVTFTPGGGLGLFKLINTDLATPNIEPEAFAITDANDGTGNFVDTVFNTFNFSDVDYKDVAFRYACNITLKPISIWSNDYRNSILRSAFLQSWGVFKTTFTADVTDNVGWNPSGDYPHMAVTENFYTLKHQLRPSYPDLLPQGMGVNTSFPSSLYPELSDIVGTTEGTTSSMDGTITKSATPTWYDESGAEINNTTGSFPLSTAMGVRTMYSGHRGGVFINENEDLQVSGTATTSGWSALADTIGKSVNSVNATTSLSYPETHTQASSTLGSGTAADAMHQTGNTDYITVGMKVYLNNGSGAYLGKVSSIYNSTVFKIGTAIASGNTGSGLTLYFKGNKSYNTYTPYVVKSDTSSLRDFVPNNNVYKLPAAVAAVDGSGQYVSFGRVLLSNPGDSILYLHSIETGTNSGMYDYDISTLTNNGLPDLGYKPNSGAQNPVLSIVIQGQDKDIHGVGNYPLFITKQPFYTHNASVFSTTVGDSSKWYSANPTTYYKNLGRQSAVAVHSQAVHRGVDYDDPTVFTYEGLAKDCQAGYSYGNSSDGPMLNTGYIERLGNDPALVNDTLTTTNLFTMTGGARVNPTVSIKMSIPFAVDSANSFGNYQSWMRIVFMPADYYNHRYYETSSNAFESLTASTYNSHGIRLYESIFLFKTTVGNNAAIITADAEGDEVSSGGTVDFGIISIG